MKSSYVSVSRRRVRVPIQCRRSRYRPGHRDCRQRSPNRLCVARGRPTERRESRCAPSTFSNAKSSRAQLLVKSLAVLLTRMTWLLFRELSASLPALNDEDLHWRFHFLVGAMLYTMSDSGQLEGLSGGACSSVKTDEALAAMVQAFSALFRSPPLQQTSLNSIISKYRT
jgi:hypothetical protein